MNLSKSLLLYGITDRSYLKSENFAQAIQDSIDGGVTMIQIREKDLDKEAFIKETLLVKKICENNKVPLIINDNVEVALECNVDGVHIGQNDTNILEIRDKLKGKIIGVSVSSVKEALIAESNGADYLGVGAIFSTNTKLDALNVSIDTLSNICAAVKIPVVAIGGINKFNILKLNKTGIKGVAIISEIYHQKDIKKASSILAKKVNNALIKKVLTIAGSDSSGGAGIQADLKTMAAHLVYGMSVITAVTAQNTQGVSFIEAISTEAIEKQIDAIFMDIKPDAIKIGMVKNAEIIKSIAKKLSEYQATKIVVDPVMVSTSGSQLIDNEAIFAMRKYLFPLATVITPNIFEAEIIAEIEIHSEDDMVKAAKLISQKYKVNCLIKGGHSLVNATDILIENDKITKFSVKKIEVVNTHGTGCTLSSAIACNLAADYSLVESVFEAKKYLTNALKEDLDLGQGSGPINHLYNLKIVNN